VKWQVTSKKTKKNNYFINQHDLLINRVLPIKNMDQAQTNEDESRAHNSKLIYTG
jgi:hypothetical protein